MIRTLERCGMTGNAQLRILNRLLQPLFSNYSSTPVLWPTQQISGQAQHGGVSSFGYSGTIAHAVLSWRCADQTSASGRGGSDDARDDADALPRTCISAVVRPASVVYRRRAFPWCAPPPHPFAQRRMASATQGDNDPTAAQVAIRFVSPVLGALGALIEGHVVDGRTIFPGAGYLEMARAARCALDVTPHSARALMHSVYFVQPLAVEDAPLFVECAIMCDGRFEMRSRAGDGGTDDPWSDIPVTGTRAMSGAGGDAARWEDPLTSTLHCSGSLARMPADGWARIEHAGLRGAACARAAKIDTLYDGFGAVGLQYGPAYRTLVQAWHGEHGTAIGRLREGCSVSGCADGSCNGSVGGRRVSGPPATARAMVHPADLDDALCLCALFEAPGRGQGECDVAQLPFAVDSALLDASTERRCHWAVSASLPSVRAHPFSPIPGGPFMPSPSCQLTRASPTLPTHCRLPALSRTSAAHICLSISLADALSFACFASRPSPIPRDTHMYRSCSHSRRWLIAPLLHRRRRRRHRCSLAQLEESHTRS